MAKLIIERILSTISIVGLVIGSCSKKKGWLLASLVSSCIRLGMGVGYFIDSIEDDDQ